MSNLSERRLLSAEKVQDLRSRLTSAEKLVRGKACVYLTGSFGRGEASAYSDLDVFLLGKGKGKPKRDGKRKSKLEHLLEIRVMADLILGN